MEDLAYRRMLDLYYRTEKKLPLDASEIARLIRMRDDAATVRDILNEFFTCTDDGWEHPRCEAEIATYRVISEGGKKGAAKRWAKERSAKAMPPLSPPHSVPNSNQDQDQYQDQVIQSMLPHAPAFLAQSGTHLELVEVQKRKLKTVPDCPHKAILALWADVLPAMPQHNPELWTGTRCEHLKARWRETAAAKGWQSEADGITYFRKLFAYVGQSQFLTGRAKPVNGKPAFIAELDWIIRPQNWAKVHEGKYHSEAA